VIIGVLKNDCAFIMRNGKHAVAQLVEAVNQNLGFDSQRGHWNYSFT